MNHLEKIVLAGIAVFLFAVSAFRPTTTCLVECNDCRVYRVTTPTKEMCYAEYDTGAVMIKPSQYALTLREPVSWKLHVE